MSTAPGGTTGTASRCPRCSSAMQACAIPDGAAQWCPGCHGLWLDNRICQGLVGEGVSDQARELVKWASTQPLPASKPAGYREPAAVSPSAPLVCPLCRGALAPYVTDAARHGTRIALDVCGAHGTWFDRGEAWALLQAVALKRAALDVELDADAQERNWDSRNRALRGFVAGALVGAVRGGR